MKRFLVLALCAFFACQAGARTIYVDAKRPNNNGNGLSAKKAKKTIQAAINIAKAGDTILVYPGTYAPIKTNNKKIVIKSAKGASKTKIVKSTKANESVALARLGKMWTYETTPGYIASGGSTGGSVTASSFPLSDGKNTTLSGFLLDGMKRDGGVLVAVTGGTVKSCTIQNMKGTEKGSGVACGSDLVACTVRNNEYSEEWMIQDCSLSRCKITGNAVLKRPYMGTGGILAVSCTLSNCLVAKNTALSGFPGGVFSYSKAYNCTIADNLVRVTLGNYDVDDVFAGGTKFYNCILFNNKTRGETTTEQYDEDGNYIGEKTVAKTAKVHNYDKNAGNAYKNTDKSNKNPKFTADYKLKKGSFCINAGKLTAAQKKLVGTKDLAGKKRIKGKAVDRGCYEY